MWNYFSDSVGKISNALIQNAPLFGKVYFPRLAMPVATVLTNLISLSLQLILFLLCYFIYLGRGVALHPNAGLAFLPLIILQLMLFSLGTGTVIASLSVKYRDLTYAFTVFIQLWMLLTPVFYPVSLVGPRWRWLYRLNPMAGIIDSFRSGFLGTPLDLHAVAIGAAVSALAFGLGLALYQRVEKQFIDYV